MTMFSTEIYREPSNIMYKSDIDWFLAWILATARLILPLLKLLVKGQFALNKEGREWKSHLLEPLDLQKLTHQRQLLHLIFVTSAVWKLKLIVCYMMTKCANKNVKTNIVELCTGKSKLIAVNFLQEVTFYLMMWRCIITQGCQIVNFYCQLLNCHEVLCGWR